MHWLSLLPSNAVANFPSAALRRNLPFKRKPNAYFRLWLPPSLASLPPGKNELLDDTLSIAAARELPLIEIERAYIRWVLEATHGNKTRAAWIPGLDRQTLYRKLDESEPLEE